MKKILKNTLISVIILLLIVIAIFVLLFIYKSITKKTMADIFQPIYSDNVIEISKNYSNSISDKSFNNINSSYQTSSNKINNTSKYYYSQLNDNAKLIYDKICENEENMKSGDYVIDFGKTFNTLLNSENGEEKINIAYQSSLDAYLLDNPDIFYIDVTKLYLLMSSRSLFGKTTYTVTIGPEEGDNYYIEGVESKEDIELAIQNCKQVADEILGYAKNDDKYTEIKNIHNLLIDNLKYEETVSKDNIRNIYGALVEREVVCEGYAKAFKYLLDIEGIENILIVGYGINSEGSREEHAWNYVKINDNWYAVDVTWDDPIIVGEGKLFNSSRYRYFLKGINSFNDTHTPTGKASESGMVFKYPELSNDDY